MAKHTDAELESLAQRGLEAIKACCLDDPLATTDGLRWRESSHNSALRMRVYLGDVPGRIARHKAVIYVPYAPRQFLDALLNDTRRLEWDASIAHLANLDVGSSGRLWIQYGITKAVFGVSARDFVNAVSSESLSDGGIVHGGTGIESHEAFPEQPGVVRALNLVGVGWHLLPVPPPADAPTELRESPWTRVSYVVHTGE